MPDNRKINKNVIVFLMNKKINSWFLISV